MTATTGQHAGYAAWNINGAVTSSGNSLISTTDPIYGMVMLSSNGSYTTPFNVNGGVLTVTAPLVQDNVDAIVSGLSMSGSGTLILTTTNTYTGGTTIIGGALQAIDGAGLAVQFESRVQRQPRGERLRFCLAEQREVQPHVG